MQLRKGEAEERMYFRASRVFNVGDNYYFNTREGDTVGPFPNTPAAQRGIELYVKCMSDGGENGVYAQKIALQGLWASANYR